MLLAISGIRASQSLRRDDDADLDAVNDPHADANSEFKEILTKDDTDIACKGIFSRFRITNAECTQFGSTDSCIRCTRLQLGDNTTSTNRTESCRERFYTSMLENRHPRSMKALEVSIEFAAHKQVLEDDVPPKKLSPPMCLSFYQTTLASTSWMMTLLTMIILQHSCSVPWLMT